MKLPLYLLTADTKHGNDIYVFADATEREALLLELMADSGMSEEDLALVQAGPSPHNSVRQDWFEEEADFRRYYGLEEMDVTVPPERLPEVWQAFQELFDDWLTLAGQDLIENDPDAKRIHARCAALLDAAPSAVES